MNRHRGRGRRRRAVATALLVSLACCHKAMRGHRQGPTSSKILQLLSELLACHPPGGAPETPGQEGGPWSPKEERLLACLLATYQPEDPSKADKAAVRSTCQKIGRSVIAKALACASHVTKLPAKMHPC